MFKKLNDNIYFKYRKNFVMKAIKENSLRISGLTNSWMEIVKGFRKNS